MSCEVPHKGQGQQSLVRLLDNSGGSQQLLHTVTGEKVNLEQQCRWTLSFSGDGWAYVSSPGRNSAWVSHLMRSSVWKDGNGRVYVREPTQGGGLRVVWLDEKEKEQPRFFAQVHCGGSGPASVLEGFRTQKLEGSHLFWMLRSFQDAAALESIRGSSSKWLCRNMASWERFLVHLGVERSEVMRPFGADHGGEASNKVTWFASTHATILILVRCFCELKLCADVASIGDLLQKWLEISLPSECKINMNRDDVAMVGVLPVGGKELVVKRGVVFHQYDTALLPRSVHAKPLTSLLRNLYRHKTKNSWALLQVTAALATTMEARDQESPWDAIAPVQPRDGKRKRVDPDERVALSKKLKLGARNNYALARYARILGAKCPTHYAGVDWHLCRRYLLALRAAMERTTSMMVCLDKARAGAGKDWLMAVVWCKESRRVGWLAPQVRVWSS